MLVTLLITACSSSSDEPTPTTNVTFTVTPDPVTVEATAGSTEISVLATADWSIESNADWCTVFPTGGVKNETTKITVKYTALSGIDARTATLTLRSGSSTKAVSLTQNPAPAVVLSTSTITAGAQSQEQSFTISSNTAWTAESNQSWCKVTPASGNSGSATVKVTLDENKTSATRNATITIAYTGGSQTIAVSQLSDEIIVPNGYTLVWNDEFNNPALTMPDETNWWYETGNGGWGNNEIQNYVAGKKGSNVVAEVSNGTLKIKCMKVGSEIISARMNTNESWTYGYMEARLKLPKGKGTWPAFWMMPKNYVSWPGSGEIDIMEEVGYNPNYTSSSIHCDAYNHTLGTQKTAEVLTAGAQDEFHVYALEWTADYIKTYVDGKQLLYFANDKQGKNATWPFSNPFYIKLNLAWGGDWGGAQGVDESCLPATYEIDYVRVFQKK
jgi:hypothetical protein